MKILTGNLKGRRFSHRPQPSVRPTSDKVRKAVFDMLGCGIQGKDILDLFSGTGAYGLEALSCGASAVTFVEKNPYQCRQILTSLQALGLSDQGSVLSLPAEKAIERLSGQNLFFDYVFLDPPYEKGLALQTLDQLARSTIVHEQTLCIVECRKTEPTSSVPGRTRPVKEKIYGDTKIVILAFTGNQT